MSSEPADIIIDAHEPDDLFHKVVELCPGLHVVHETGITDIIIPGNSQTPGWAIERKEAGDLVHTWLSNDERLRTQLSTIKDLERMSNGDYRAALMIVGNPTVQKRRKGEEGGKLNVNAIQSLIDSVTSEWDIHVMPVYQEWRVPYTIRYLVGKIRGEKSRFPLRKAAPKTMTPKEQAIYVVQGFPGVGPATTDQIRSRSACLAAFVDAIWKNSGVDAIGLTQKQSDKIRGVLEAEWFKETESK